MTRFNNLQESSGITDVFMDKPDMYRYALSMAQEILREKSHLSPLDRELIAAYTSFLNSCEYCFLSHKKFAESLGALKEDLSIFTFEHNIDHRLGAILKYVRILTLSPSLLTTKDKDIVIESGFSEDQLKDAIAVCSIFNFYNRVVEGHGITPGNDTFENIASNINRFGYDQRYV